MTDNASSMGPQGFSDWGRRPAYLAERPFRRVFEHFDREEKAQAVPCADIVQYFRGEPTLTKPTEWRWGTHGSLSVSLEKNCWYNHEAGEGGDTIGFVEREFGCRREDAISWLLDNEIYSDRAATAKPSVHRPAPPLGRIVATYDYVNESGVLLFQVVRCDPKAFRQRRPNGQGGWSWSVRGVPQVPYRLPELMQAIAEKRTILIDEGEKDVDTSLKHGIAATCNAGGAGRWHRELSNYLRGADVVLVPDNDFAGRDHMNKVGLALTGIAARIRLLELPDLPEKGDVSDWLANGGTVEMLSELIARAPVWKLRAPFQLNERLAENGSSSEKAQTAHRQEHSGGRQDQQHHADAQETTKQKQTSQEDESPSDPDEETSEHEQTWQEHENTRDTSDAALIDELARLDPISYDRRREKAAEELRIRVTTLDEAVKQRRAKLAGEAEEKPLFEHWDVNPWPVSVDGDALILMLVRRIRSHVVMTAEFALTVALWVVFTWVHAEAAIHSPILIVTSPEAECGKTTLLGLIGFLVRRALSSVGISSAVLYRSIEKWRPTLIIDEADVAFVQNEDLRAVVNSGWTRGQGVLRCDGDEHDPRLFSTFCPKAIGLKGKKLQDTTASRAVAIELKRKLAHEEVMDFRHIDDPRLQELRQQLARWAIDNAHALQNAQPALPHGFTNRVAANWNPLLAIAEAAGGEWPDKVRVAAAAIAKLKAALDASIGIQLLSDIRTAFGNKDCVFSATLVAILNSDSEGHWAEYNRGKPFTQKQLANRLKAYGIVSETVWIHVTSAKGYKRSAFEDVWTRYASE